MEKNKNKGRISCFCSTVENVLCLYTREEILKILTKIKCVTLSYAVYR